MKADVLFRPVRELSELVRARQVSPVELAEFYLDRLERIGPRYNAVVTVMREHALGRRGAPRDEIAAGRWRGPLHGIPYGAKDLLATAAAPTTWGAAPYREQRFDFDATVIRKLEAAGAVLCAKLAMIELAGGMGYRQPHASFSGPCINPWDAQAWTGGSSSGSGAAVASGLVPFAIGSETWGSILSPAGYCGLAGLRPTYGRVSRHGAMALCWTLDKLGPLALTADDCGLVLDAIAGADPDDPTASDRPYRYDTANARSFRFGMIKGVTEGCEEAVVENFTRSLENLRKIGTVEEVTLPDLPWEQITRIILQVEAAAAFEDLIEAGGIAELAAPEVRLYAVRARCHPRQGLHEGAAAARRDGARGRSRALALRRAGRSGACQRGAAARPGVPERHWRDGQGCDGRHRQWCRAACGVRAERSGGARAAHEHSVHEPGVGGELGAGRRPRVPVAHGLAYAAPRSVLPSPPPGERAG
jgi:aspartyl-tRNA(Asn)/glutamyl-tRNA(Gln) amidotransferase subunit A